MPQKIFKYEVKEGSTLIPKRSTVIRVSHVDDGFYKGDFVWAIVDPEDTEETRVLQVGESPPLNHECTQELRVTEKQTVEGILPHGVGEDNGKIYLHGEPDPGAKYEVCFFKTGQEIDIDLNEYFYIGLCRLWIVQELGLYTFIKKVA